MHEAPIGAGLLTEIRPLRIGNITRNTVVSYVYNDGQQFLLCFFSFFICLSELNCTYSNLAKCKFKWTGKLQLQLHSKLHGIRISFREFKLKARKCPDPGSDPDGTD